MSSGFLGGLFGKKDKNPQQSPNAPAPKPVAAPAPASKLQPGLSPVPARTNIGAATTQPMVLPKSGGLKPAKPALISGGKSTQRIVLPGRSNEPGVGQSAAPVGNLSLPLGMVVRLLPDSVRAISPSQFESLPDANQDVSLPLGLILPQLPSGKVEISVEELVAAIPRQYVRPQEEIASQLSTLISMPLMDVVMRIPPDMLALRPDQKEVDAAVVNMADPFTEELLREQAEAARKAEAQKQPPPLVAPPAAAASAPVAPPPMSPSASQPLPEGMPTLPLPRPLPTRPPDAPAMPTVPPPSAPGRSATGPRPPSIALPRPSNLRPPHAPAATTAPNPLPPTAAPVAPPPPPPVTISAASASTPQAAAPADAGLSEEMKKLLAAAEAQLGEDTTKVETATEAIVTAPANEEPTPQETVLTPPPAPVAPPPPPAPLPKPAVILPPPPTPKPEPPAHQPLAAPGPVSVEATLAAPPVATKAPGTALAPTSAATPAPTASSRSVNLNDATVEELTSGGCPSLLAQAIVGYRANQGPFHRLEDLLKVPGITKATYALLTGREVTAEDLMGTVNEVLGFPADQKVTLKDITDRVGQWPDVVGCLLGQASGLPLVGKVPDGVEKSAVMAFVPRLLTELNTSFKEFSGRETNELIIPSKGTSYHIFRNDKLYLVILSRRRHLPRRYMKVARYVLSSIDATRHQ